MSSILSKVVRGKGGGGCITFHCRLTLSFCSVFEITEIVLLVFTVCGSYLTEDSGNFYSAKNVIMDDNYYVSYEETRCLWKVNPKSDTSVIWLTFTELSLGHKDYGYCR